MEPARRVTRSAVILVLLTYLLPTESQVADAIQATLSCPPGWYQYMPKIYAKSNPTVLPSSNLSCVKYMKEPRTYAEAQRQCRLLRSQLVNVNKTSTALLASAKAATVAQNRTPCNLPLSGKGILQSPNFPGLYPDNEMCQWSVQAKNSSSLLFLLSNVNLEICCDNLTFSSSSSRSIRIYNSRRQSLLFQSNVNITFSSDDSIGGQGFSILYFSVNQLNTGCGGTLRSGYGWLASPEFQDLYENNMLCKWTIYPALGKTLLLQFLFCDVEQVTDTLRVYREPFGTQSLLVSVNASNWDILWNGPLQVQFSTNRIVQKYIFVMQYMSVSTDCGLYLQDSGNFSSPGFSKDLYPPNVACVYNIGSSREALTIYFTTVDLEPCCDKISVYKGRTLSQDKLIATLTDVRSASVFVPEPFAIVTFTSDSSEARSGFSAYFKSVALQDKGSSDPGPNAQASFFWTGLYKESEKYYWDAVSPVLDTAYFDSCPGIKSSGYSWECNDTMSTACAAGQLKTLEKVDPGVVFSSASCDLELPYFCAMDVNASDMISTSDPILGQQWLYNSVTQFCYKFISQPTVFSNAKSLCASEASILAAPTTSTELAAIVYLLNARVATYIGVKYASGIFIIYGNGMFTVSDSWANMLQLTTDVDGDPSRPILIVEPNTSSCLVLQIYGGTPVFTGKPCSGSFPYVCQKACNDVVVPFNLTLNMSFGTLLCGASVHSPTSIFWTRNGQFVQLQRSQQGMQLKVFGPLAEYRCGVIDSTNYTKRIYSNPVLAAEPGNTALVYRVIITSFGNYSPSFAKYVYYNLKNSYTDLFAAAVATTIISRNFSIIIDYIRPSPTTPGSTEFYLFISLQPLLNSSQPTASTGPVAAGGYSLAQLQMFQKALNTSLRSAWPLLTADPIVRHPFYCLAFAVPINNVMVYFGKTLIGDTAVFPGCCYALCGGNFTTGGFWGPVIVTNGEQTSNVASATLTTTSATLTTTSAKLTTTSAKLTTASATLTTTSAKLTTASATLTTTSAKLTTTSAKLTTTSATLTTTSAALTTTSAAFTSSTPIATSSTSPSPAVAKTTATATTLSKISTGINENITTISSALKTEPRPTFNVTYTAVAHVESTTVLLTTESSNFSTVSTTDVFRKFVEGDLSAKNVHQVGLEIVRITNSTASLTPHDVADAAEIVSRMASLMTGGNLTETLYAVPSLIGQVVGNLMNANESTLSASQNVTTISLQASLESSLLALSGAAVKSGSSINSTFLRLQEDNLAFQIIIDPSIHGLRIGAAPSLKQAVFQPLRANETGAASSDSTTVRLSPSVANAPKTFLIFNNSKLFQANSSFQSDGSVVSVQIAAPSVDSIPGLVTLVFNNIAEARNGSARTCGFWNYTLGDWSSAGCTAVVNNDSMVTCTCDHLTNFAALLAVKDMPPIDKVNAEILNIISFIGLAISIVCLTAVVLSFLALKKMRRTVSQKVLFNLALSLLSLDILFIVGIDRTDNKGGCIAVAALLHYFLLASFMWMLMESILQYLRFVKVLGTYIPRFIIKTAIPAWGAPAVVVAIICGTNLDLYYRSDSSYCFATEQVIYYAVLLPIGLILVVNFFMFGIVLKNVCCRKKKFVHHAKHSEKNMALLHAQAGIAICVILGLTWIFGFLTPIPVVSLPFQYLFCICNSLQGFLIFLFHCAREKALRDEWKRRCCGVDPSGWKSTTSTTDESITMRRSAISMTSAVSNSTYGSAFPDEGGRIRRKSYEVQGSLGS